MKPHAPISLLRDERGFGLIELLVSMIIGLVVSLAAFSMLEFTTSDVSRITERAHADQTGRVALEKIMLQLHSACVAVTVNPVQAKSTQTAIKFISESSPLNANKAPTSELSTVRLHEIIYTPASGSTAGTLVEKSWPSYGTDPNYLFHNTTESPTETKLLKGVEQTGSTPIFQYYRYYQSTDSEVKAGTASLGQLDPTGMSNATMAIENAKKETEAEKVAKVTVNFTLAPEGHESVIAKGGQPIALEDSAIFRLAPSSEASENPNFPCTQTT